MATPLVTFAAGMGTVAVALGAGFATTYALLTAPPSAKTVFANRPDAPPPTVEKVDRKKEAIVAAVEQPPLLAAPVPETTGSAGYVASPSVPIASAAISTTPPVPPRIEAVTTPTVPPSADPHYVRVWDGGRAREVAVEREPESAQSEQSRGRFQDRARGNGFVDEPRRRRHVAKKQRGRTSDSLFRIARGTI